VAFREVRGGQDRVVKSLVETERALEKVKVGSLSCSFVFSSVSFPHLPPLFQSPYSLIYPPILLYRLNFVSGLFMYDMV
jgi:hypothetical protein